MKTIKYIYPLFAIALMSCEKHDPVDDQAMISKPVPTSYWELKSSEVPAGKKASFVAQYYGMEGAKIKDIAICHDVKEHISYTLECPLVTTFKYSISFDTLSLARQFQPLHFYDHSESFWNNAKKAYVFDSSFMVSNTLSPVIWKEVTEYDQEKFDMYFPKTIESTFLDELYPKLAVADLRKILTIDNPRLSLDNFMTHVDSTINENTGRYDHFILEDSKPLMKELFYSIPFDSLLYDKANQVFKIEYVKEYTLNAKFRVIDEFGKEGYSEPKEIKVN